MTPAARRLPSCPVARPAGRCSGSALILLVALVLGLVALPGPAGLSAQSAAPPSLDRVDSLVAGGNVAEAREALATWWETRLEDASPLERQRAMWLRGKLTVDPGMARRDYLRLVLEYPGGPHSADALLRLGQAEHAAGRMVAAARHYEQLLRDYPESPHRLDARRWLEENREAVVRARARTPPSGSAASAGPSSRPSSRSDSSEPEEPEEPRRRAGGDAASTAPARADPVSVQLGAFSSEEGARDLLGRVRDGGFEDVRLVRVGQSRLIRVRTGRFADREGAEALRERLRAAGFDAVVVTDGAGERPVQ